MKRISRLLAAVVIALAPVIFSSSTFAQAFTCQVGFTGPDTNNMCISTVSFNCDVENENDVIITNTNTQEVSTGTVTNGQSGTVTNNNGATFTVTITNGDGRICTAVQTVPADSDDDDDDVSVQPLAGGSGGGGQVATLPDTSGDTSGGIFATLLAILGLGALATTLGALVYRRIKG